MSTAMKNWDLADFSGGLDLRSGAFSEKQNGHRIRRNVYTGRGKQLERRPPCLDVGGLADSKTQGLLIYQGRFYVFGKRGDVIAHTGGVLSLVTDLLFDAPEYTSTFEVLEAGVHEGFPWALIRHAGDAGTQTFIHVWDGLLFEPTYAMDPAFPGSYSDGPDELAGQEYDGDFTPAAATAVSKVWVSNLRGNVQCCRTADTRVWNQRDSDSFLLDGEHYVFRVPGGAGGLRTFMVPSPATALPIDGRWAFYVLEKAVGSAWVVLDEVAVTPATNDTWQPVQNSAWGSTDRIQVKVRWGSSDAGLIRLRLVGGGTAVELVTAPTLTITGAGLTRTLSVGPYSYRYRSGDRTDGVTGSVTISQGNDYLVMVGPGGVVLWNLSAGFPNGQERERNRIVQRITWGATETEPNYTTLTGTVQVTASSATITGTGTAFLTQLKVDQYVLINGERKKITAIASDTSATTETNFAASAGPLLPILRWTDPAYLYAYEQNVDSAWYTELLLDYNDRAGAEDAVTIATRNHDPNGGLVSAIGHQLNRLLVFYPGSIQSWSVDQATNATQFLASLGFGTGTQPTPSPVPFYESVAVGLEVAPRSIFVSGPNNDTLKDNNIGEKIEGLPMPIVRAGCHWVHLGQLVLGCTKADGSVQFLVLDYSKESKISAWNEWTVTSLPVIDHATLQPAQERLYFRAGNRIRYFDAKATVFRDADEIAGAAYLSDALGHLNQLEQPNTDKKIQFIDYVTDGQTQVQFEFAPNGTYGYETTGPQLDNLFHVGSSYGQARFPVGRVAPAVAVRFSSRDESGWRLRSFSMSYQYKKR